MLPSRTGPSLCLDALRIALSQVGGSGWYTSTLQLQLASLQVCALCWDVRPLHFTVGLDAPHWVWEGAVTSDGVVKRLRNTRVPTFQPRGVLWKLPISLLRQFSSELLANVQELKFWNSFKVKIDGAVLPASLQNLNRNSDQPEAGIAWPVPLRLLNLGNQFNHPIDGIKWPASLVSLSFGTNFDQPIDRIVWPASLPILFLWGDFNQPIVGVAWPPSLRQLIFGTSFNQPVVGVAWPMSLNVIFFGLRFNQPVDGVLWPESFQKLSLGWKFNQPIDGVE